MITRNSDLGRTREERVTFVPVRELAGRGDELVGGRARVDPEALRELCGSVDSHT